MVMQRDSSAAVGLGGSEGYKDKNHEVATRC